MLLKRAMVSRIHAHLTPNNQLAPFVVLPKEPVISQKHAMALLINAQMT
jgi:hypothetical protein